MDKLTPAKALDLLHTPLSAVERCQVAALIEALEADAGAVRATLTIIKNAQCPPQKPEGGCSRFACHDCYHKMMDAALATTAGAALLARLEATKNGMTALEHIIKGAEGDEDDFGFWLRKGADALAAWRGGER
jgi:hypothetical protein